jgi:hypothetical protein
MEIPLEVTSHLLDAPHNLSEIELLFNLRYEEVLRQPVVNNLFCESSLSILFFYKFMLRTFFSCNFNNRLLVI